MTATAQTPTPVPATTRARGGAAPERPAAGPVAPDRSRGWAAAGVAASVSAVVGLVGSSLVDAVYDRSIAGDAEAITARIAEQTPQLLVFHVATMTTALLLLVVAAGLRRLLRDRLGDGSLLPDVAAGGLLLVSVAGLMGTALTTEFAFVAAEPGAVVPGSVAFFGHWTGTVPWLWSGAGVTALAVAVASLRHGALPRWAGWTSLVLGVPTVLLAVSPLQYMTAMTAPLWLLVVSTGLLLGGRARTTR